MAAHAALHLTVINAVDAALFATNMAVTEALEKKTGR